MPSGRNGSAALPVVREMRKIRIYTTRWCGFCVRAKTLLESRGVPYEEISLDDDPAFRQTVYDATGGWTVPQIVVGDQPIGGYTELWRLDREGRLDDLLVA
jgi:glutaredoxin 3